MTMEVEEVESIEEEKEQSTRDEIIDYLTNNESICFKSQQIGENDLTKQEKAEIAIKIYDNSKLNFLLRFGKHFRKNHLVFFEQFTHCCSDSYEITTVLKELHDKVQKGNLNVKNRRYEALKQMIDDKYFSEIEMMKRNPLLYDQLVGQYLTEEEKQVRDKLSLEDRSTLVKVLMEGIERDDAKVKQQEQENNENKELLEEDDEDECSSDDSQPTCSLWGEFTDDVNPRALRTSKKTKAKAITDEERKLLKEEFISSMYQHFLDGKDEDFDYDTVDNNDKYDNSEMKDNDEEDKYFDSEEPELVSEAAHEQESEDELDIYMSALNQSPAVAELSRNIQNL